VGCCLAPASCDSRRAARDGLSRARRRTVRTDRRRQRGGGLGGGSTRGASSMATISESGERTNNEGRAGRPVRTARCPERFGGASSCVCCRLCIGPSGWGVSTARRCCSSMTVAARPVPSSDGLLTLSELSADDLEAYKRYRPERDRPACSLASPLASGASLHGGMNAS
jgi:hypothetical protein